MWNTNEHTTSRSPRVDKERVESVKSNSRIQRPVLRFLRKRDSGQREPIEASGKLFGDGVGKAHATAGRFSGKSNQVAPRRSEQSVGGLDGVRREQRRVEFEKDF